MGTHFLNPRKLYRSKYTLATTGQYGTPGVPKYTLAATGQYGAPGVPKYTLAATDQYGTPGVPKNILDLNPCFYWCIT